MTDDDTVQLSPQQVAIRNAVHDLMDRQLAQYSFERLIATIPVIGAFLAANEAEQRLLGMHMSQLLLRAVRRELQSRRDAATLAPPPTLN